MSTFVNNDVASGQIVYAADHNTQGALLAAVINGGIDNNNIASGAAIAGSKLADASITPAKLAVGTITTTTSTTNRSTTSTSFATLTDTLALTAGKWQLTLKTFAQITNTSGADRNVRIILSSDASTETNPKMTQALQCSVDAVQLACTQFTSEVVTLTGSTTFTLMGKVSGTSTTVGVLGASQATIIEARKLSNEVA